MIQAPTCSGDALYVSTPLVLLLCSLSVASEVALLPLQLENRDPPSGIRIV